jgi:hypothetical protein
MFVPLNWAEILKKSAEFLSNSYFINFFSFKLMIGFFQFFGMFSVLNKLIYFMNFTFAS